MYIIYPHSLSHTYIHKQSHIHTHITHTHTQYQYESMTQLWSIKIHQPSFCESTNNICLFRRNFGSKRESSDCSFSIFWNRKEVYIEIGLTVTERAKYYKNFHKKISYTIQLCSGCSVIQSINIINPFPAKDFALLVPFPSKNSIGDRLR